jgi:hypothetical protein
MTSSPPASPEKAAPPHGSGSSSAASQPSSSQPTKKRVSRRDGNDELLARIRQLEVDLAALEARLEAERREHAATKQKAESAQWASENHWRYKRLVDANELEFWTGCTNEEFEYLHALLEKHWPKQQRQQRYSLRDKLALVLIMGHENWSFGKVTRLYYGSKDNRKRVREMVMGVLNAIIAGLNEDAAHAFPSLATWRDWCSPLKGVEGLDKMLMIILDGSGTLAYSAVLQSLRKKLYCYWKGETQLRWTLGVAPNGQILYVSRAYCGSLGDDIILGSEHQDFYAWLRKHVDVDKGFAMIDGEKYDLVVGGDAGYTRLPTKATHDAAGKPDSDKDHLGGMKVAITFTGIAEADDGGSGATFKKSHPNHLFLSNFAPYRSVVERVIGRVQARGRIMRGPRRATEVDLITAFLRVYSGLVSREVTANPMFFSRLAKWEEAKAEDDESGEDGEENGGEK